MWGLGAKSTRGRMGMGVRQRIQGNPRLVGGVGAVLVIFAAGVIYHETLGQPHQDLQLVNSAFYSDDDGKSWFIDDASKIPPFDHDGKKAVRAVVYRYDDDKKFVAYLERFSDAQLPQVQAVIAAHPEQASHWLHGAMQVKKPGSLKWIEPGDGNVANTIAYEKIITPEAPDGSKNLSPILPSDEDAMKP